MALSDAQRVSYTIVGLRLSSAVVGGVVLLLADRTILPIWSNSSGIGTLAVWLWLTFAAALFIGIAYVTENAARLLRAQTVAVWPIVRSFLLSPICVGAVMVIKFTGVFLALGIAMIVVGLVVVIALTRIWAGR